MQMIRRRKSTKPANRAVEEDNWTSQPGEFGRTTIGPELVQEPESSSQFGWEDTKEVEPRTIWVWDREKQAWMEIIEKPSVEEPSRANGITTREPIVPLPPYSASAPVTHKVQRPRSARKLATRASVLRVIDALAPKSKAPKPSRAKAAVRERTKKEETRIIFEARQEAEELARVIVEKAKEQAQNAPSKWNDNAIEAKDKEEREVLIAEQEAPKISLGRVAELEQQGQGIIKAVEEKAETEAENIIARAEEKARAQAESIIAQVEEKAKEQAETIAAEVKVACQETLSAVEHQAQYILKTVEEKAREIKALAETIAKAVPEQLAPRREEGDQKERTVPHEGTAELVIGPPVDLSKVQKVLNRLTKFDQIRVLDLEGSKGKGISVKLFSGNVARLPDRLAALPEVDKVSDLPRKSVKICPGQLICPGKGKGNESPPIRLLVTMTKRSTYVDI